MSPLDHRPVRVRRVERAIQPVKPSKRPKAHRPTFDVATALPEDFAGRKLEWINSLSGKPEEVKVLEGATSITITDGILTFPGIGAGIRSVRLSAITAVK